MTLKVDAHQHFWALQRSDYCWLTPALEPVYRDFLPEHLRPCLERAGIEATVLVQAAPTEQETEFLLDIARTTPFVRGVVGWVDMTRADFPERLAQLREYGQGYLKGIRPMLQDLPDDAWVASPALDSAFEALIASGLTFDALVRPRHLPHLKERLRRSPGLRVVIDHAAKPDIAGGAFESWHAALSALADDPNVFCKLSGLVTEAGDDWTVERIRPYAKAVLDLFGSSRVMWGSDWPVLNLTADYDGWVAATADLLAGRPASEVDLVMGENARGFYALDNGAVE